MRWCKGEYLSWVSARQNAANDCWAKRGVAIASYNHNGAFVALPNYVLRGSHMKMKVICTLLAVLSLLLNGFAKADTDLGWVYNVHVSKIDAYPANANHFAWFSATSTTTASVSGTTITSVGTVSTCTAVNGGPGTVTAIIETAGNTPVMSVLTTALVSNLFVDVHFYQATGSAPECYIGEVYLHH